MKNFIKYTVEVHVADEQSMTDDHPNLMSYDNEQRVLSALAGEFDLSPDLIHGDIKVETIKAERVKGESNGQ